MSANYRQSEYEARFTRDGFIMGKIPCFLLMTTGSCVKSTQKLRMSVLLIVIAQAKIVVEQFILPVPIQVAVMQTKSNRVNTVLLRNILLFIMWHVIKNQNCGTRTPFQTRPFCNRYPRVA